MIILIADDDRLIRFTMKSMLNDILTCEYSILEAANGEELRRLCKEKKPDIAFVDIKMPYMNGIEAITACREETEHTQFVIISGYSEFEYAQSALKLGVKDYLLKPVEEEKLQSVIEKLRENIEGNKSESNAHFQLKLFNAFNYFATVGTELDYAEESYGEGMYYQVVGLKSRSEKKYRERHTLFQKEVIQSMNLLGEEFVKKGCLYAHIYSGEGTPYFVFCIPKEREDELLAYVKRLSLRQKDETIAFHFVCLKENSVKELYQACEKLDGCQGFEMNYRTREVISIDSADLWVEDAGVLQSTYQLLEAWEQADAVAYKDILNQMYRKYMEKKISVNLENLSRYCSVVMQRDIAGESYKEFCRSFIEVSESMYENVESADVDIVDKVKEYVEKHYMDDIGIAQLGGLFDITPNYLSTIFHQKAGCKFIDYLTEVRIANAKRLLLQNRTASVKDIALMVGYSSSRYFATIFQKAAGMKPSVYRKDNPEV